MSWENAAIVTTADIENADSFIKIYTDKGIPISPDYLVEMERCGEVFVYKWKRKHEEAS